MNAAAPCHAHGECYGLREGFSEEATVTTANILALGGDGIGPEVVDAGLEVLDRLAPQGERCGPGIYEAVHGSAPDIAGKGIANPLGTILSVAMLLDHGLGRPDMARQVEMAVERVLQAGVMTPDLGGTAKTSDVTKAVLEFLA